LRLTDVQSTPEEEAGWAVGQQSADQVERMEDEVQLEDLAPHDLQSGENEGAEGEGEVAEDLTDAVEEKNVEGGVGGHEEDQSEEEEKEENVEEEGERGEDEEKEDEERGGEEEEKEEEEKEGEEEEEDN
jgi:hypothetical protein